MLWKVPAADQALIITGLGAEGRCGPGGKTFKIITGGGAFVIPALQKAQYLSLQADKAILDVEGVDSQKIPVGVRGVAIFKVGDDACSITNATTRFLHDQGASRQGGDSQMHDLVREVFHGHLRSIIGGLTVEDLIANRNELAQQTREASSDEMQKLGLVVDSLQIQEIVDPTGYIKALGEPRAAEVKMQARIAQAQADREATEREQEAEQLKAAAKRDTAIKQAEFQAEMDKAAAMSAQAGPLADAEARKNVVVQETAVAELEAQREERRLETTVRKPADADAYQARVEAEGQREARIALAEAAKREVELRAEADARKTELAAAADAKRVELAALAQAKQVREVGRGRGGGDAGQGRGRGRRHAGQGPGRGGGDRQARRGARAGVRGGHRPAARRQATRDRAGVVGVVQERRQPDGPERRPGDGRDHRPGDRAGRPGAGARAGHARGQRQRRTATPGTVRRRRPTGPARPTSSSSPVALELGELPAAEDHRAVRRPGLG